MSSQRFSKTRTRRTIRPKSFKTPYTRRSVSSRSSWTGSKKNLGLTLEAKRQAIDPGSPNISIYHHCELLGLNRSSYYYQPCRDTSYNEYLMRLIDEQYMRTPFYGSPQMTRWLKGQKG